MAVIKIGDILKVKTKDLKMAGIESARLDTLLILENILRKDRAWILANQNVHINPKEYIKINLLFNKRIKHMPIAYLLETAYFYGRKFYINKSVLIPRPETEDMINLATRLILDRSHNKLNSIKNRPIKAIDLGTGCGAIGITLSLELPYCQIDLADISKKAIRVAKSNVDLFTSNNSVYFSDLLLNINNSYDIVVANLPYVPDDMSINKEATYEPKISIYAGNDGLNIYKKLSIQLKNLKIKPLYILIESFPFQHIVLSDLLLNINYILIKTSGFVQMYEHN